MHRSGSGSTAGFGIGVDGCGGFREEFGFSLFGFSLIFT